MFLMSPSNPANPPTVQSPLEAHRLNRRRKRNEDPSHRKLPTGRAFRVRASLEITLFSTGAAALILTLLILLMRLPPDQLRGFFVAVGGAALVLGPVIHLALRRMVMPVSRCLDSIARGEENHALLREGFRVLLALPRNAFRFNAAVFQACTISAAGIMALRFQDFSLKAAGTLVFAGACGGLLAAIGLSYFLKRRTARLREGLAVRLTSVDERRELIRPATLAGRLRLALASMALVPLVFALFMVYSRAPEPMERLLDDQQVRLLAEARDTWEWDSEDGLADLQREAERWHTPVFLLALSAKTGKLLVGDEAALTPEERARLVGATETEGMGAAGGAHQVHWIRPVGQDTILVASSPRLDVMDFHALGIGFLVLAVLAVGASMGIAQLAAADLGDAIRRLRGEAERVAAGDLRAGWPLESDDELGDLGRAFAVMAAALRETVGQVSSAADGVEARAGELGDVATRLAEVAAEQRQGTQDAATGMQALTGEIAGVARNAENLNELAETSSSAVLQLAATSDEQHQAAEAMAGRVNEMAGAIDQMTESVGRVGDQTATLAEAAAQTSDEMEEMAAAMLQVNHTAESTAQLSSQVVEAAEIGRSKVRDTIDGMTSIAQATETAEQVIRSLGKRAKEMRSILDVIDEVADETALLALNAAIIAAQAGEHGRGFAVVTDEIKDLADRVLSSTKEIGSLIHTLEKESEDAVGAVEVGTRSVSAGAEHTAEAGTSLEEITRKARESGERMQEIVRAVAEQTQVAGRVAELMGRVNNGVEAIRSATAEQSHGNTACSEAVSTLRQVAQQVQGSSREQARNAGHLREGVDGVHESSESIHGSLDAQSSSCSQVSTGIEELAQRTLRNEESAGQMAEVTQQLRRQAEALRESVSRFRL